MSMKLALKSLHYVKDSVNKTANTTAKRIQKSQRKRSKDRAIFQNKSTEELFKNNVKHLLVETNQDTVDDKRKLLEQLTTRTRTNHSGEREANKNISDFDEKDFMFPDDDDHDEYITDDGIERTRKRKQIHERKR